MTSNVKYNDVHQRIHKTTDMYLLAINCGSSSIKGKLYSIPSLDAVASLGVSNIASKGEKVKIKVSWVEKQGKDISEDGDDGGSVKCALCPFTEGSAAR